ncbi:MAG: class I SAM-dependent methyltransferase [Patescibacteria group bacterium]|jgi:ubiquinone/menaquinone biosynthesis C-methylase UbiE
MTAKKNRNWKIWDQAAGYSDILYRRATGDLPEMESAKSLCQAVQPVYEKGMKILDVGCGAGHYLRSLRVRLDKNVNYTGVDQTKYSIALAKKAFGGAVPFFAGDIYNLKFADNSFDLVMCNNVILHLPPPPTKAIAELIRVAKKYIIIRTVFGQRNYLIKEVRTLGEGSGKPRFRVGKEELFNKNGEPLSYNFFNMYTEEYLRQEINKIGKNLKVSINADDRPVKFDNRKVAGALATKTIGGRQVSGNLLLDWKFILIKK